MKYISSRGAESGLTFQQVLFSGYAKDGGLYFPEQIPKISMETLQSWQKLSYPEIVANIMGMFIDESEIAKDDLQDVIQKSFAKFGDPASPIQIARLQNNLNIAELFHGPTLAFKDLALGVVGQLYEYFLNRSKKHMTVIIGTSGDTGSAAISALRGLEWVDTVVLLPHGRCTMIQELQMTTVLDSNVHCYAVDGTSDDLDVPIKAVFSDSDYVSQHNLCSINSINWARILVQISHFVYCYLQMADKVGDQVTIICPTGACGNIASGYVATQMGVPIKLVAAVTPNDIVDRTFKTGDFSLSEKVLQSWATAMDIQVPYNVERIILMAAGLDTQRISGLMAEFESENKKTQIPDDLLARVKDVVVDSVKVENTEMLEIMKKVFNDNGGQYCICPHTAVGAAYHYQNSAGTNQVVLATASPDKFPEAVEKAEIVNKPNPNITKLFEMEARSTPMNQGDDWEKMLRLKIEEITKLRL